MSKPNKADQEALRALARDPELKSTEETLRALASDPKLKSFEKFARSAIIWTPGVSLREVFIILREARK